MLGFLLFGMWCLFVNWFLLKDGVGGSYRLPSLDRLAYKQRLLQENGGLGLVERNGNGTATTQGGAGTDHQTTQPQLHISSATALVRSAPRHTGATRVDEEWTRDAMEVERQRVVIRSRHRRRPF